MTPPFFREKSPRKLCFRGAKNSLKNQRFLEHKTEGFVSFEFLSGWTKKVLQNLRFCRPRSKTSLTKISFLSPANLKDLRFGNRRFPQVKIRDFDSFELR